jgi:hypothetical protein
MLASAFVFMGHPSRIFRVAGLLGCPSLSVYLSVCPSVAENYVNRLKLAAMLARKDDFIKHPRALKHDFCIS